MPHVYTYEKLMTELVPVAVSSSPTYPEPGLLLGQGGLQLDDLGGAGLALPLPCSRCIRPARAGGDDWSRQRPPSRNGDAEPY